MRNILLVDDETDMFPLFNIKFKKEIKKGEVKFIFFSSSIDALNFIKGASPEDFELVISDISMPDMDGLELLREIKLNDLKQKVYIISGLKNEALVDRARGLGAAGFLDKPIDFNELKELILS
ncbi:response regulator receiver domain protein [Bacteriovorax sp. BSW11_IV]|uniref:response regulator n=1 Tax=Bacteriovorax sp. BSW11_IV TaxID=1353529 RepID=UPI00038A402A|nr:response regulator [Bacteriovorax sp. BSW11_IV]EQC49134.1 response regulator receiver domain protein [Bacteriovorax sp. BSW11_IV]